MSAKDIRLAPISASQARDLVARVHYSGKSVQNSQVHVGVFYRGELEGAMQFGPPLDKRKVLGLVEGTEWQNMVELNRMAFSDRLPRNSESRALGVAFRILKRHKPCLKWVLSFADATQCGDGAIYRASGFVLTGIKLNDNLVRLPGGRVVHYLSLCTNPSDPIPELGGATFAGITGGTYSLKRFLEGSGLEPIEGYQLRYIRFLDPAWRSRLAVEEVPFSRIKEVGAGMYKGKPKRAPGQTGPGTNPERRCEPDPPAPLPSGGSL